MSSKKTYRENIMNLAGKIMSRYDSMPVNDLDDALAVVLSFIGENVMAGTDQIPDPEHCTIEKCSASACFMAACSVPIFYGLREMNHVIDPIPVMHRAGGRVFKHFTEQDRLSIMDSGIGLFRELACMTRDNPKLEEWVNSVHNVTNRYVLTEGETDCVELFAPLYLVFLMAARQLDTRKQG